MKIPLAGRRLPLDLAAWTVEDRLAAGVTLAGIAAGLVLLAIVAMLVLPGWVPIAVLVVALVVLVFHGAVDFVGFKSTPPEPAAAHARTPVVTLRCADCGTVFDLEDPGFRPLYHVCPGCGSQGVLEAEEKPPPLIDYSKPAPEPELAPVPTPRPAPGPPPPTPHAGETLPPPPPPVEVPAERAPQPASPAPTAAAAVAEDDHARFRRARGPEGQAHLQAVRQRPHPRGRRAPAVRDHLRKVRADGEAGAGVGARSLDTSIPPTVTAEARRARRAAEDCRDHVLRSPRRTPPACPPRGSRRRGAAA